MLIGDFASFYAVIMMTLISMIKQRQAVNEYLSDWLINMIWNQIESGKRCILEEPEVFEMQETN